MGYFLEVFFTVIAFGVLLLISRGLRQSNEGQASVVRVVAYGILGIGLLLETGGSSFHQIPAGSVGVVYQFGGIVGQIPEGAQWTFPWQDSKQANVQIQAHPYEKLSAFSKETQDVFIDATLNTRVSPGTIQELYRSVGPNYSKVLIDPRVHQIFKDETVKHNSVDIAPNREAIRDAVTRRLEAELSPHSIEVVSMFLNNISFNPGFQAAIENKQIATQNALEEKQRVEVATQKAQQAIEEAKGKGQAILEVANKQAEANTVLAQSLTPILVQYSLIQRLGDQIKVILLPPGQQFILSPDALGK